MPTVLRRGPYRVFFYSGDREEAPHVHVERDGIVAKFWLRPVRLESSGGFSAVEVRRIDSVIRKSAETLLGSWHEFFGR